MTFNLKTAYDKTSATDAGKILIKATCKGPITTFERQIQLKMQVRDASATKNETDCTSNHFISTSLTAGNTWNDIQLR